ncbi:phage Gp37/Gp68 family protein [Pleomorphomonas oryzae]|uniref:phage Gp37/Gp68 family protein n=1 Tax=Pleomorphomonas oryzae TaxID=261934 RepID=UPI00042A7CCD|nr:phage Gp37/Gp68 family protein [Pleomorphomonas oryzae]
MADRTSIEWSDMTWNPIAGCTRVSEGCRHCYAERLAARGLPGFEGLARWVDWPDGTRAPRWTGVVLIREHLMDLPLRKKRPRRIFVNSMSDLFHDAVPDEVIDRIFAVMALAPRHTFQILTKRPERMRDYLSTRAGDWMLRWPEAIPAGKWYVSRHEGMSRLGANGPVAAALYDAQPITYPLPNVWMGTSVENQRSANERRTHIEAVAAAGWNTFASYEPALGYVAWEGWEFLKWLISGGESGPRARPTHPAWHRVARDFSAAHGIPYLFKQWGEWGKAKGAHSGTPGKYAIASAGPHSEFWPQSVIEVDFYPRQINLFGGATVRERIGKRAAGRLLDGVEHNGMPGG